ncbi:hypothetical protein SMKI_11G0060 [Saccharomyces mikatae IFO 1815]|uniref:Tryptophan synthase beta chain-like PALP domain-containing protein n=1 Tax=Saccharomyces mikatae IFO 1815 TaxID=226126 RepID=A0AA35ND89_SACMI|nr:uncharacterized protein SMKI_11G0060 [Saccharomyces mikatae IFO 1815]CAI4034561.1 hypothetical protein SMKI_11G0060 [Saccharomyces mikatae IFO 1815]
MNAVLKLSDEERNKGVIAFLSGNHAQAFALSAKLLNVPATIVMPEDASTLKVAATTGYGAHITKYNRYTEDRDKIGRQLAAKHGFALIPPYDHPDVIAGQSASAKKLLEEVGQLDALFVLLGGGGLLSGSTLASRSLSPDCKIFGVEPEAGNDGQQSFRSGSVVHIDTPNTIAGEAQTQHLGEYTFAIIRENVDDILTVTDGKLIECMHFLAERMKLVVGPTACLGHAGAVLKKKELVGEKIGIRLSRGNVDMKKYAALIAEKEGGSII